MPKPFISEVLDHEHWTLKINYGMGDDAHAAMKAASREFQRVETPAEKIGCMVQEMVLLAEEADLYVGITIKGKNVE